jgi:SAM-dependent methyltransferase
LLARLDIDRSGRLMRQVLYRVVLAKDVRIVRAKGPSGLLADFLASPTRAAARGVCGLVAGGGMVGVWWWWRLHPKPRPFAERLWIDAPHPFVTPRRLREALVPVPGGRLLEIGVGGGRFALPAAGWLGDTGQLDVLDLQEEMLVLTMRRALHRSITNVVPVRGDAAALPYSDSAFDAVYLVSTLGQLPDMTAALRELRRVVRPTGHVVIGELCYDPHGVFFGTLQRRAIDAGLRFERRVGGRTGYLARFTPTG